MNCPYCNKQMIHGCIENTSIHHMIGLFRRGGEERSIKSIFKPMIEANIPGGSEHEAWYCDECKKVLVVLDNQ